MNLVLLHDFFDTYESTQILVRQIVRKSHCQALLMNYPGQALTQYPEEPSAGAPVLNNDYYADCLVKLMEVCALLSVHVTPSPPLKSILFLSIRSPHLGVDACDYSTLACPACCR